MRIPSGTTDQYIYFVAVDNTDGVTRETGLTGFTVYRSRDGAAAAAMTTPTVNETDATNMPGVYELLLDEDMTIGAGNDSEEMCFHITVSGMRPVTRTIELYRPKITVGQTVTAGSGAANANLVASQSNSISSSTLASGTITSSKIATGAIVSTAFAAGAIDAAAIAADAITAAKVAADVHAEAADANWDEARSGHTTAGSFGEALQVTRSATAQAGAANTITLDASASATDDIYNGQTINILSGTGAGQSRIISNYVGSTKVATVNPAWTTTPSSDSVFLILPVGPSQVAMWNALTPSDLNSGRVSADVTMVSGDITAANNLESALDGTGGVTITAGLTGNVTGNLTGSIGSLATQAKADVNAEVLDVLNTDTFAEPTGVPPATDTLSNKIGRIHMALRNQLTITATKMTFYDDAGNAEWEKDLSDDGTTYTETEGNAI